MQNTCLHQTDEVQAFVQLLLGWNTNPETRLQENYSNVHSGSIAAIASQAHRTTCSTGLRFFNDGPPRAAGRH